MTQIKDLLEQGYRDLLAAAFAATPNQLPDLVDDQAATTAPGQEQA